VDLVRHPKITELGALVGSGPSALGYVVAIWAFAAEFYGDGRIPDRPGVVASFERMAGWSGEAGCLVTALVTAGFLDRAPNALTVHDWSEYQSPHVARRERERAKKRRNRAHRKGQCPGDSPRDSPGDGAGDMDGTRPPDPEPEREVDPEPASHSDPRSSLTEHPVAGWPGEQGGQEADPGLIRFRSELASMLGMPALGVGKDRFGTLAAFERYIGAWGREHALAELARLARERIQAGKSNGTPANLSWWVGWLNTVATPAKAST
jgi:hypothetical protein